LLTYVDFASLPLGQMVSTFPNQNQHMLYTVLANFTMNVFGHDFAGFRMPAVLFGVGSLPFLFLLGRRTNGTREAWLATLLMTFAYHHVWFSQNARGYSGLLFFTLAATWLLLVALERRRTGYWVAYSACLALGLWVHMTMLFVAMAHAAAYGLELALDLAQGRRDRGRAVPSLPAILLAWFFGATLTTQLYALALPEFFAHALHEVSLESDWTNPMWVFREMIARLRDVGVVGVGAFIGLGVMILGWLNLFRRDRVAAVSMALPGILGGATMLALGHNLWPRFFFFCAGFILLTLARGAFRTPEFIAGFFVNRDRAAMWGRRVGTAGLALLIGAAVWTLPNVYKHPKQDYSGARDYVVAEMGPQDEAVSVGLAGTAFGRYFAPDWPVPESAEELDGLVRAHRTVWLVHTLSIQLKAWHPDIWETMQRDFEVVRTFPGTLGGGEVMVSRSLPSAGVVGSVEGTPEGAGPDGVVPGEAPTDSTATGSGESR
ncbi:MAG: hypothetical protein HKN12_03020, partial [Gemmatimonadetes bacterium]|nr:hypothetical protein [Gemmatimonadota bacterium]